VSSEWYIRDRHTIKESCTHPVDKRAVSIYARLGAPLAAATHTVTHTATATATGGALRGTERVTVELQSSG
jgi:hypothetical protein